MTRYTASVVGGGMGGRLSVEALTASDRYDLVAAADISPTARAVLAEQYPDLKTFDSHEAMFAACPTEVVCVSTWAPSHRAIVEAALRLPLKGMLVEKPLADTSADGAAILGAIRQKRVSMVVPHGLLVAAHSTEILQRVRSGEIGALQLIEIQCAGWDIINAGIHWFNYAHWLTGREPVECVMATCDTASRTYRDGMQVESEAVAYAQTKSGVRIVLNTGDYLRTTREGKGVVFHIVGSEGTIEFWAWESAYRILNAAHPGGVLVEVPSGGKGGHQRYLEALAEQVDSGKTDYEIPESSLAALELCEGAYLAHKWQCKVDLPLSSFTPPARTDWQPGQPYPGAGGGRNGRNLP